MSLETLLLLQRCLKGQTLQVSDPNFATVAAQVSAALTELDAAIAAARKEV